MKHARLLSAMLAACMLAGSCITPAAVSADDDYPEEPIRYGDVNLDSSVDVADAVAVARYYTMDWDLRLTDQGKMQGDVNRDGNLDDADLRQILLYIARQVDELGVPMLTSEPNYQAMNLMDDVTAEIVNGKDADEAFIDSQMKLTVDLFKGAAKDEQSEGKDLLVSPLSVSQAIAMAANGANGTTKEEMEKLLGDTLDIDALNQYYYRYTKNLTQASGADVHLANSLWVRDNEAAIRVPEQFLQTTADYYGADAFKAPFDDTTVKDVNDWVNYHTHSMIPSLIDHIDPNWIMILINALAFEAEWADPYNEYSVSDGTFHAYDKNLTAEMMYGDEYTYLLDENATGFMKPYKGGEYSFAAILPDESVTVSEYIDSMTADSLKKLLNSKQNTKVETMLPKFKYEYSLTMNKMLEALGMKTAFDPNTADFTGLNSLGDTWIDTVLHKTFIQVDDRGTKAAAVTAVFAAGCAMEPEPPKRVYLDRPFIYMIVDNSTNLPIFIGYVLHPTEVEAE